MAIATSIADSEVSKKLTSLFILTHFYKVQTVLAEVLTLC